MPFAAPSPCEELDKTDYVEVSLNLKGVPKCTLPVTGWEKLLLKKNRNAFRQAVKRERALFQEVKVARVFPPAFSKAKLKRVERYLRSFDVLLANMFEANRRRSIPERLSLHAMITAASSFKVMQELAEPARVIKVPKGDNGFRATIDFGPVARGAQLMCGKVLRLYLKPRAFQFTDQGSTAPVENAIKLITEKGFSHVAELDIVNHFGSFECDMLKASLPLPEAATYNIICASDAMLVYSGDTTTPTNTLSHPLGLPQGGLASSTVAEWSVARLKIELGDDLALINYADNFFLFAKSQLSLDTGKTALSSAIAKLPGGCFHAKLRQSGMCSSGFKMLGYFLSEFSGQLKIAIDMDSAGAFWQNFDSTYEEAGELLKEHASTGNETKRIEGVSLIGKLCALECSWLERTKICNVSFEGPILEMAAKIAELTVTFDVSQKEISDAQNPFAAKWKPGFLCS